MEPVKASKALFIKLGEGGEWEAECVKNGILRFGYREVPHEFCVAGDWSKVKSALEGISKDSGAITRHAKQIQQFYEADESVLWITFHSHRLWWCFARPEVSVLSDNDKVRKVMDQWRDTDIRGETLRNGKLSGKLLAVRGFQGTICSVSEIEYLLHKINGTVPEDVAKAQDAFEKLQGALIPIIKNLHHKDLEILTDLIFRQAGWQRVGETGGTEKDIDLDLESQINKERIAVQIKSRASTDVYRAYHEKFQGLSGYTRFYFVTHSPDGALIKEAESNSEKAFVFWGPKQLAEQAARGGLTGWLIDKAS